MATMGPYGLPGLTHHEKHNQEARVERFKNARIFEYIPVDPYDVFEIETWACY